MTAQLEQIKMQELKAENECLKTDCSTDDTTTPEKLANYAQGTQMLLNTTTQSTKAQKQEAIRKVMQQLQDLFHSL